MAPAQITPDLRALLEDEDPKIRALARAVEKLLSAPGGVRRLTIREVVERVGLHPTTILKRYSETPPRFPAPIYFGTRRLWPETAVEAWEAEQIRTPNPPRGVAARNAKRAGPRSSGLASTTEELNDEHSPITTAGRQARPGRRVRSDEAAAHLPHRPDRRAGQPQDPRHGAHPAPGAETTEASTAGRLTDDGEGVAP